MRTESSYRNPVPAGSGDVPIFFALWKAQQWAFCLVAMLPLCNHDDKPGKSRSEQERPGGQANAPLFQAALPQTSFTTCSYDSTKSGPYIGNRESLIFAPFSGERGGTETLPTRSG